MISFSFELIIERNRFRQVKLGSKLGEDTFNKAFQYPGGDHLVMPRIESEIIGDSDIFFRSKIVKGR